MREVDIFGDEKEVSLRGVIKRVAEEDSRSRRLNGPGLRRVNLSLVELYCHQEFRRPISTFSSWCFFNYVTPRTRVENKDHPEVFSEDNPRAFPRNPSTFLRSTQRLFPRTYLRTNNRTNPEDHTYKIYT